MIFEQLPGTTVEYVSGTPGDQFGIYGKIDKIKDKLNWVPTISFETGMINFINKCI